MSLKAIALVLVIAGVLALAYGGFTYTRDSSTANIGPLSLTVKDRETVNIPLWAGVAILLGGLATGVYATRKS